MDHTNYVLQDVMVYVGKLNDRLTDAERTRHAAVILSSLPIIGDVRQALTMLEKRLRYEAEQHMPKNRTKKFVDL